MVERFLFSTGLISLAVAAYLVARSTHLRAVRRRVAGAGHTTAPGLAAFQPGQPAVLYFTAPGCVPCRTVLKPALQRLVVESGNRFQILEVNAEQQPEAASYWNVLSVPTIFVLDPKGEPRHVHYGVASQDVLRSQLGNWLNPSRQVA